MFFLRKGTVSFVLTDYDNFEFLKIKEGYFFGEIELLFNLAEREDTIIALEDVELLCLNSGDFTDVFMSRFRDIGIDIAGNGYIR